MSLEQWGDAQEVAPTSPRGPLVRLLLALLAAGVVLGILIAVGAVVANGVARTEAGLCRITAFPCTELTLTGVESLAGIDLPDGSSVLSGYAEEGDAPQFRAQVLLPAAASVPLAQQFFAVDDRFDEFDPLVVELDDVEYWQRPSQTATGSVIAASGTRADGRVVLMFDIRP